MVTGLLRAAYFIEDWWKRRKDCLLLKETFAALHYVKPIIHDCHLSCTYLTAQCVAKPLLLIHETYSQHTYPHIR